MDEWEEPVEFPGEWAESVEEWAESVRLIDRSVDGKTSHVFSSECSRKRLLT